MKERAIELLSIVVDELTDEQFENLRDVLDELDSLIRKNSLT